jgi:hypothetical protein
MRNREIKLQDQMTQPRAVKEVKVARRGRAESEIQDDVRSLQEDYGIVCTYRLRSDRTTSSNQSRPESGCETQQWRGANLRAQGNPKDQMKESSVDS